MRKIIPVLVSLAPLVLHVASSNAITPTGFMPGFENTVAGAVNMTTGVIVPALSWIGLIGTGFIWWFNILRVPGKMLGLVMMLFCFGAGLPWLATISGGTLSTSFCL